MNPFGFGGFGGGFGDPFGNDPFFNMGFGGNQQRGRNHRHRRDDDSVYFNFFC
jgi:hypothetical protein